MNKECFVIMGFGKKQRPLQYDQIDFDYIYKKLVCPAIEQSNLRPVRADEINTNELVSKKFFQKILTCDIVIADISALNANAMYELGVRHALRPYSTVIIKDDLTDFPFDINQNSIITYSHQLKGGQLEKSKQLLVQRIENLNHELDSPVYTFLNQIKPIDFRKPDYQLEDDNLVGTSLCTLLTQANSCINNNDFVAAEKILIQASEYKTDAFSIHTQIAFCMYKNCLLYTSPSPRDCS